MTDEAGQADPTPARATGPVGIGFIGTGMISNTYLENLTSFPDIRVIILGDLDVERARAQAVAHGIAESGTSADVIAHPDVEIVVNLTIPAVHAAVASSALAAGKHVWSEKPISVDRESGLELLALSRVTGLRVGVAPDTVLGPGIQTARRAIARGDIGVPLSAQMVMQHGGPDLFHPAPEFLFARGAGPLFDMGPYYFTTLIHLFGSVDRVAAVGSRPRDTRTVQVGERVGQSFPVEVPTHVSALTQFAGGGVAQSLLSFDSPRITVGVFEVTGSEGTMLIPDPNTFSGEVTITRNPAIAEEWGEQEWHTVPEEGVIAGRGLGVLDMARSLRGNVPHIATGDVGYHVLDTLVAIEESAASGEFVSVASSVGDVPLLPEGWDPFEATL
jgi:predicted dehydrogenase